MQERGLAATLGEAFPPLVDTAHQTARATVEDLHTWAEQGRLPAPGEAGWATVDAVARAHPQANPAQVTEITLARQAALPVGHPDHRRPLFAQTARALRTWGATQAKALGVPQLQPWGESNRGIRGVVADTAGPRSQQNGDQRAEDGRGMAPQPRSPGYEHPLAEALEQGGRLMREDRGIAGEGGSARQLGAAGYGGQAKNAVTTLPQEMEVSNPDGAKGYYAKVKDRLIGEADNLGAAPRPSPVDGGMGATESEGVMRFLGERPGIRNSEMLTPEQEAQLYRHVKELGQNKNDFQISSRLSYYSDEYDFVALGPDMFPAATRTANTVFETMTPRAAVAHEAGHLISTRAGTSFEPGSLFDEVNASLTGRELPGLNSVERYQLLRDAVERARIEGRGLGEILKKMKGN